jgi:phosphoenolpyruvate synthase/pyruvate phosphate dikinase
MKEDLANLNNDDVVYFGERIELYLISHLLISGMLDREKLGKIFGLKQSVRWLQINYYFFEFKQDLIGQEIEIKNKFNKDGVSYAKVLIKDCLKYGHKLQKVCREISRKSGKINDKLGLIKLAEEFLKAERDYTVFYNITMFEGPVMDMAKEIVKKYAKDEKEAENLFNLISTSSTETVVEKEQEAFLNLAIKPKNKQNLLISRHAEKYGWMSMRFFIGNSWNNQSILDRLSRISKEEAEAELIKRSNKRKEIESAIKLTTKNFSKKDKGIVKQVRDMVYLRNQRADFFHESGYHIKPFLDKVAGMLDVSYSDLLHICVPEIILALEGNFDYKKYIDERKKNFIIYYNFNEPVVLQGIEVENYLKEKSFLNLQLYKEDKISGKIAYKGIKTGRVKIIKTSDENHKVENGDVVVSIMTIPSFIPALEKASAFVTDEGGITCHAAIVAREMGKPCIIGTKIATKVLKDGDLVEVDAERGIVKILERSGKLNTDNKSRDDKN